MLSQARGLRRWARGIIPQSSLFFTRRAVAIQPLLGKFTVVRRDRRGGCFLASSVSRWRGARLTLWSPSPTLGRQPLFSRAVNRRAHRLGRLLGTSHPEWEPVCVAAKRRAWLVNFALGAGTVLVGFFVGKAL